MDLPPREAIYEILGTCLRELVAKGIVAEVVSASELFPVLSQRVFML